MDKKNYFPGIGAVAVVLLCLLAACSHGGGRTLTVQLTECDSAGVWYTVQSAGGIPWRDTLHFTPDTTEITLQISDSVLSAEFYTTEGGDFYRVHFPPSGKAVQIHLDPLCPLLCYVAEPTSSLYPKFARAQRALLKNLSQAERNGAAEQIRLLTDSLRAAAAQFTAKHYSGDPAEFAWLNFFLASNAQWQAFTQQVSRLSNNKIRLSPTELQGAGAQKSASVLQLMRTREWMAVGSKDTLRWTPERYSTGTVVLLPPGYDPTEEQAQAELPPATADTVTLIIASDLDPLSLSYRSPLPAHTYQLQSSLYRRISLVKFFLNGAAVSLPAWGSYRYSRSDHTLEPIHWQSLPLPQKVEDPQEAEQTEEISQIPQEEVPNREQETAAESTPPKRFNGKLPQKLPRKTAQTTEVIRL